MAIKDLVKIGFRTCKVFVKEWEGTTVTVREPSHVDFSRYLRTIKKIEENDQLSDDEKDKQFVEADSKLFITILLDENGEQACNENDLGTFKYGSIHTRLLNKAIELMGLGNEPVEEAKKK